MQNNSLTQLGSYIMARIKSNTPPWFKFVRNVGIILTATGTTIVASPIVLPASIVTIAGYCIVAGAVAASIAQTAVDNE
jgi:hypothetical protein